MSVPLSFIIGFAAIGLLQVTACFLFLRQQRSIERVASRVNNLVAGISLLTDTTETGLRDVAHEIGRSASADAPKPRQRAATQRRITTAARRGRSVQEIAAAEQLSEGEVNLRLQLAQSGPRRKTESAELATA
jgi:hypothetical protein